MPLHQLKLTCCHVDLTSRQVVRAGQRKPLGLSEKEVELLRYLAERPGQPISRGELAQEVWGYHKNSLTRTVDTTVRRLRKKIEAQPSEPDHIVTEYGVGYRFELSQKSAEVELLAKGAVVQCRVQDAWSLWPDHPAEMGAASRQLQQLARSILKEHGGLEVRCEAEGMRAVFAEPPDALRWASAFQRGLLQLDWPEALLSDPRTQAVRDRPGSLLYVGLRVCIGIDCGALHWSKDPLSGRQDVLGPVVHAAGRLAAAAQGGQVLLSPRVGDVGSAGVRPAGELELWEGQLEPVHSLEVIAGRRHRAHGLSTGPTNLGPLERGFVGRKGLLGQLQDLVLSGARLVALIGAPGAGKSALARRHATSQLERFSGGVWYCDIAQARGRMALVQAVADALSVPIHSRSEDHLVEQLRHALRARGKTLLVLDGAEGLQEDARSTISAWLERAPELRVLLTSRERLGLRGETVVQVPPLSVEDGARLFRLRARTGRSPAEADESEAIADLVTQLDGLPLAIELAAARTGLMSPRKILSRLGERLDLLRSRQAGTPARQSTLRSTLDWSWKLLTPGEQETLVQCSVFADGFTLDAFEEVVDLSAVPGAPDPIDPLDALEALVDHSLLQTRSGSSRDGEPRFELLRSVQVYATEKRQHASFTEVEIRHGQHFARLACPVLLATLSDSSYRSQSIFDELSNLQLAAERARQRGEHGVCTATTLAAVAMLRMQGPIGTAAALLDASLASPPPDAAQHARLLLSRARLLWVMGEPRQMAIAAEQGLCLCSDGDDRSLQADLLEERGEALISLGDVEQGSVCHQQALALACDPELGGDARSRARLLARIGMLMVDQQHPEAEQTLQQALELAQGVAARAIEGQVHRCLVMLYFRTSQPERARSHADQARQLYQQLGDRSSEARIHGLLASHGDLSEKASRYLAMANLQRQVGRRRSLAIALSNLGGAYLDRGQLEQAREAVDESLALHREVGDPWYLSAVLGTHARLLTQEGCYPDALAASREALELIRPLGDRRFEAILLGNTGDLLMLMGEHAAARAHLEQAIEGCRETSCRGAEAAFIGSLGELTAAEDQAAGLALIDRAREVLTELGETVELGKLAKREARVRGHTG